MEDHELHEAARRMSETLTPGDLDKTLHDITHAAVEMLPDVDYASITIRHQDGSYETVAPTHELLLRVDAAQYDLGEGPCFEAATHTPHVVASDLDADPRYARYAPVATAEGIRAQAGMRLFTGATAQGALNLYSRTPGAFADLGELGDLFAYRSGKAIEDARELEVLREASRTHRLVGHAVGIAMERYGFTEPGAFAFLTRLAQHHQVELPVAAEAVVTASTERAD
jgi:GAF domain-containing protein